MSSPRDTQPLTVPMERARLVAIADLQKAVVARDARRVHLLVERLRFVFGFKYADAFAEAQKALPSLDLATWDALLEEGEEL